jgi:Mrp family chromosome partitioning ATPase
VNTALTLAQSGARVLLIDADLRRSRCHKVFSVSSTPGLVDHLVGHVDLQKCIRPVELGEVISRIHAVPSTHGRNGDGIQDGAKLLMGSVDVLPAGTRAPNPAEILGSMRMRETLELLREAYDFVIVDSPPVLPVADSLVLGTMVDAVVLVVKGQTTPKNLVRQAAARLERMRVNVIGSVLNAVDVTSGDYY